MSAVPVISDDDFQRFRDLFYCRTGIQFDAGKRYFVDKRLIERMAATDHTSFRSYLSTLRFDHGDSELQALTNLMTVNETYFFREEYQFHCLVRSILPELMRRRSGSAPIRIWVMPSSSGEEAYSIAICLLELWADIHHVDVEIVASDIDTRILEQARRGRYSSRSVAQLPAAYLGRYFKRIGNEFQISDELRQSIEFTRVNLSSRLDTRPYRNFDVVFCRNLLIYFDDQSRKAAAETFFDAMKPGGYICLGHSESMSRISPLFRARKFPEAIVYQKPTE
ncbi:CheR family methyltransferase [Roseateles amylovorans]|uniref:Chemotaxis protein methyltransferase n=1 Tax=Roseateles amylovorans TaxID=2978473 RepID=A0ABY6AU67_9BURK|nr:protein-glutamate O-methyltransferase CheR [Roseateles amylovorans]UXH76769.1 protein-glutamate O-methyltransferase CheR [Roseateles amylovorans]